MRRLHPWIVGAALALAACGGAQAADPPAPNRPVLTTLPPVTAPLDHGTTAVQATPTTVAATARSPIVLGFAGDVSFTHGLDAQNPFGEVSELLAAPDYTAVNLETTVAEPDVGSPLDKTYVFKSPPASVQLLADAGVDAVSLANNHTLDYRREGLLRTIELLDGGGITNFGAGEDAAAAYRHRLVDVGDWKVGFVGFTHVECGWVADDTTRWPEAAWACPGFEDRTIAAVAAADDVADLVVVMVHWGIQLDSCPQPYQRDLAAAWVAAGADLVVGSHPHVLQGVERIGDAWVVYSTGNFAFPSARGPSARSAFFTFEVGGDESGELTVTPIAISAGRPQPMEGDAARDLLSDLSRWSSGWSFDASGEPSPRREPGACG